MTDGVSEYPTWSRNRVLLGDLLGQKKAIISKYCERFFIYALSFLKINDISENHLKKVKGIFLQNIFSNWEK